MNHVGEDCPFRREECVGQVGKKMLWWVGLSANMYKNILKFLTVKKCKQGIGL
jgi:hypothetical protein